MPIATAQIGVKRPCSRCGKTIVMLLYRKTGKPAPINVEADPKGNIAMDLEAKVYVILSKDERPKALAKGLTLHTNHYSDCVFRGEVPSGLAAASRRPAAGPHVAGRESAVRSRAKE